MAFDLVFARSTCKHWLGTSAYIKCDLLNVITYYVKSGKCIAEQASICVFIKHIDFIFYSLDKTLIYRLVSFIALWSRSETVILTFNRLESIGANNMDTNPGKFSSKTLISFRLKKYINMDDMGVSKLSGNFHWKVNYSFKSTAYRPAHFLLYFIHVLFFSYLYLCIFSCVCVTYNCTVHGVDLNYILYNCVCDNLKSWTMYSPVDL